MRRRGINVTTSGDADRLHATEEMQHAYAAAFGRVIVTHHTDLPALHAPVFPQPAIADCHPEKWPLEEIIRRFVLAWESEPDDMTNRVEFR